MRVAMGAKPRQAFANLAIHGLGLMLAGLVIGSLAALSSALWSPP